MNNTDTFRNDTPIHLAVVDQSNANIRWGLVGLVVVGVFIIIVGIYSTVNTNINRTKRTSMIRRNCSQSRGKGILVLMHAYRCPDYTVKTIFDIFERSSCPLRITVAVYQESGPSDHDAWHIYQNMLSRHLAGPPNGYNDNIRILNYESTNSSGKLCALAELFRRCHTNESRVLIINPGTLLCDRWDEWVDERGITLSQVPAMPQSRSFALDKKATAGNTWKSYLNILTTAYSAQVPRPVGRKNVSFPVFEKKRSIATIRPRILPEAPTRRCGIIAVSCGFCAIDSNLFQQVVSNIASLPPLPDYAADYYLSSCLYDKNGKHFWAPEVVLCYSSSKKPSKCEFRPQKWPLRNVPYSETYASFSGATPTQISGRAMLGLLPGSDWGTVKYGSAEELERAIRPFKNSRKK